MWQVGGGVHGWGGGGGVQQVGVGFVYLFMVGFAVGRTCYSMAVSHSQNA